MKNCRRTSSEDLNQRDLERRDLAVHEDTTGRDEESVVAISEREDDERQIELNLEPDVDVGTIDGGRPPQREATVRDLVETRALRVGELLVLHRLLESRGLHSSALLLASGQDAPFPRRDPPTWRTRWP